MELDNNSQSRRWMLTINNPEYTDSEIETYIKNLEHFKYAMFQREKGEETGTVHIQMFIVFSVGKRFGTIKNYFPKAHIEKANGSNVQCRDYCSKSETRISGPFEIGEFAEERSRTDIKNLVGLIEAGASNNEIKNLFPNAYFKYIDKIERVRQDALFEKNKKDMRFLEVCYIYGKAGVGKTRYIYDNFNIDDVYRITSYDNRSFDSYAGQEILVLDEFDSSIKLTDLLCYLDIYPVWLSCRYTNKVACWKKVYILSNLPLDQQYSNIQTNKPEQFKALLRRIHKVYEFKKESNQTIMEEKNKDLLTLSVVNSNGLPF